MVFPPIYNIVCSSETLWCQSHFFFRGICHIGMIKESRKVESTGPGSLMYFLCKDGKMLGQTVIPDHTTNLTNFSRCFFLQIECVLTVLIRCFENV